MRYWVAIALAVWLCGAGAATALADEAPDATDECKSEIPKGDCECYTCECAKKKAKCPPKYDVRRFMEDWSPCLCLPCEERAQDSTDLWKAVPFGGRKAVWGNFGGHLRLRWEQFQNQAFGAPPNNDDNWMLLQLLAHADIHFGDWGRIYLEGIYASYVGEWDRALGARVIDENRGDLLNGFAEVTGSNLSGWVGRRELLEGQQRLIGPLAWANIRRAFQGAGVMWQSCFHEVEAFAVRPVDVTGEAGRIDGWNEDADFAGIVYRNRVWTCRKWEAYALVLNRNDAPYSGMAEDELRFTVGAHIDGKLENTRFDYDLEAAYQFGTWGDGNISAGFASLTFGWKPCDACFDPRLAVGFDWASGDQDPDDDDVQTFNQLFPTAHKFFGIADVLGRQNLVAARIEASVKPAEKLTFIVAYHGFWRASDEDGTYTVAGTLQRPGTPGDDDFLGTELDLLLKYKLDRHWSFEFGWGHFFTGDFYSDTGADDDINFIYLSTKVTV